MRRLILLAALVTACGVGTDVMMLSPEEYDPVAADSVRIFTSADQVLGEYEEIALIDAYPESHCSGALCSSDREDVIEALREKAGNLGANALILDFRGMAGVEELRQGHTEVRALAIWLMRAEIDYTNVVMLTPHRYAPVAPDSVWVFLSEWDVKGEYERLALIDAYEVAQCSAGQCPHQNEIIQALKTRAAEIGANAIIIEGELPEIRDVRRTETAVRVIAIRFLGVP